VAQARALLPGLTSASVVARRAGLRELTPDARAYLGPTHIDGLYVASGFSGHGFMHAPYTGRVMAELITRGTSPIDLTALRPERFATG
ncbi:MAG: FAD-binding oxidoreductase, partial [Dehalococcoidia bacterium]|nr:FAD-binding oxidoreductase [Dehalococcoidia bacterium]